MGSPPGGPPGSDTTMPPTPRSLAATPALYRTKQELVYRTLRDAILRCELAPDQRLVIDDIARRLNVSTIPVREALQLLQSEGLVTMVPHVGAAVSSLSRESVVDVFSVLEGLQVVAGRLAASEASAEDLNELSALVKEMDQAIEDGEFEHWADVNTRFHARIGAIPGLTLLRPADANETAVAWKVAMETRDRPVLLALSRQDLPTLDRSRFASAEGVRRGAYVLSDAPRGAPTLILIATGSEVGLVVAAAERLSGEGVAVRCVSMPSWDLFERQPKRYREEVLPPSVKARLAVELGVSQGWERYVGDGGDVVSIDRFGASAPAPVLLTEYGFTVDDVVARARKVLTR